VAELAFACGYPLETARELSLDELELMAAVARRQTAESEARRLVQMADAFAVCQHPNNQRAFQQRLDGLNQLLNDHGNDRKKHR
jgi:hypothetical protein